MTVGCSRRRAPEQPQGQAHGGGVGDDRDLLVYCHDPDCVTALTA
jgi:hypothetical protein